MRFIIPSTRKASVIASGPRRRLAQAVTMLERSQRGRRRAPRRGPSTRSSSERAVATLADLDGGAGLLELLLERVGVVLRETLLDGLRSGVRDVLGLLEAQTGRGPDHLDDRDLRAAGLGDPDVERRLLLDGLLGGTAATGGGCGHGDGCGRSRDAPLLLEGLLEGDELEHGQVGEISDDLFDIKCHGVAPSGAGPTRPPPASSG